MIDRIGALPAYSEKISERKISGGSGAGVIVKG
jgi:hypothetical protein